MSIEGDLAAVLRTVCPRVAPGAFAGKTTMPYVVYQRIGGPSLRYLGGQAADKRHVVFQVAVWAESSTEAIQLINAIETVLCAATAFTARDRGEAIDRFEEAPNKLGAQQDFDIWATR